MFLKYFICYESKNVFRQGLEILKHCFAWAINNTEANSILVWNWKVNHLASNAVIFRHYDKMLNRWALMKKEKPYVCFIWPHHLCGSKHAGPLIVCTLALSPALQIANDNSFPSSEVLLVKYCQSWSSSWLTGNLPFSPVLYINGDFLCWVPSHRWY